MRRARQRALIVAFALSAPFVAPSPALAWHAGQLFDRAPGGGGGGGLFYVGSPREHGWDCTACHLDPPGDIDVTVAVSPAGLLDGTWTPGQAYAFTVTLDDVLGLDSPLSNQNSLVLTVLGSSGSAIGTLGGYTAADFHARGPNILASAGLDTGNADWTFTWTAPPEGNGRVTFYLAVVDGNGAGAGPGVTLQDPTGDDVFVHRYTAERAGTQASFPTPVMPGALAGLLALAALRTRTRQKDFSSDSI